MILLLLVLTEEAPFLFLKICILFLVYLLAALGLHCRVHGLSLVAASWGHFSCNVVSLAVVALVAKHALCKACGL